MKGLEAGYHCYSAHSLLRTSCCPKQATVWRLLWGSTEATMWKILWNSTVRVIQIFSHPKNQRLLTVLMQHQKLLASASADSLAALWLRRQPEEELFRLRACNSRLYSSAVPYSFVTSNLCLLESMSTEDQVRREKPCIILHCRRQLLCWVYRIFHSVLRNIFGESNVLPVIEF